jgi:ribonuclease Z
MDGRRMPDKLAAFGITGPNIARPQHEGRLVIGNRLRTVEQVSEPRRGPRFAFIMDTRLCDAASELADGANMLVCDSTFADAEAALAREWGHLTAGQAGRIAAEAGGCSCSLISRSATSMTTFSGSPRKPQRRSAAWRYRLRI